MSPAVKVATVIVILAILLAVVVVLQALLGSTSHSGH
jgi:hypothetical protein